MNEDSRLTTIHMSLALLCDLIAGLNLSAIALSVLGAAIDSRMIWTRRLALTLGMERSIIRYRGGHGAATNGNACIADVLVKYLFDLTIPAEGFSCPGQPIQFGAPAAQKGIDGKHVIEDLERDWLWRPTATRIRKEN